LESNRPDHTVGLGQMPEIVENLSVQDHWDVINHIRTLK
jgi:hypothetical protein